VALGKPTGGRLKKRRSLELWTKKVKHEHKWEQKWLLFVEIVSAIRVRVVSNKEESTSSQWVTGPGEKPYRYWKKKKGKGIGGKVLGTS